MKQQKEELSESTRIINYILNRQQQIKTQEKICKESGNKTDLIKLQSKQIQLFRILEVMKAIMEG